ncbi:hypothetical protein D9M71_815660 [compost metagenome]
MVDHLVEHAFGEKTCVFATGGDPGAGEHGVVGPAGVVVPADQQDWLPGPFTLVEALLELLELAPVSRRQAAEGEDVATSRSAVAGGAAQALLKLVEAQ